MNLSRGEIAKKTLCSYSTIEKKIKQNNIQPTGTKMYQGMAVNLYDFEQVKAVLNV